MQFQDRHKLQQPITGQRYRTLQRMVLLLLSVLIWLCLLVAVCLFWGSNVFYGQGSDDGAKSRQLGHWNIDTDTIRAKEPRVLIYRIIGNDLPPRHQPSQGIVNLNFVLRHEPSFPGTTKVFLLNRLVDQPMQQVYTRMLENSTYHVLPFRFHEYHQARMAYDKFEGDFFYEGLWARLGKVGKMVALNQLYENKNMYAMNNNGARNWCLDDARARGWDPLGSVDWVAVFDGNIFLTKESWTMISDCLREADNEVDYIVVPMTRLTNNSAVLDPDFVPVTGEEPQIIFRRTATQRFSENMRYGRRSKVELLWRLGVIGAWDKYTFFPWESSPPAVAVGSKSVKRCGWVARLFSGQTEQERNSKARNMNRMLAIQRFIDRLDESLFRTQFTGVESLLVYDEAGLARMRRMYAIDEYAASTLVNHLIESMPTQSFMYEHFTQNIRLRDIFQETTRRTLVAYFTGDLKLAQGAGDLVRRWFLTRVNTTTTLFDQYAQAYRLDITTLSDNFGFHYFLDAVKELSQMHVLSSLEVDELKLTAHRILEQMLRIVPMHLLPHRRSYFDLQMISLAAFSGQSVHFLRLVDRLQMRKLIILEAITSLTKHESLDVYQPFHQRQSMLLDVWTIESFAVAVNAGRRGGWNVLLDMDAVQDLIEGLREYHSWIERIVFASSTNKEVKFHFLNGYKQITDALEHGHGPSPPLHPEFTDLLVSVTRQNQETMRRWIHPFWYIDSQQ